MRHILVFAMSLIFLGGCAFKQESKKKIVYIYKRTTVNGWWKLSKIHTQPFVNEKKIKLRLNSKYEKFYGNDSCNNILGVLKKVNNHELIFGGIAGTMRSCKDMKTPQIYINALQNVRFYKVDDPHLFLYDKDKNEILTFLKSKREFD